MEISEKVYVLSKKIPKEELFGLISQIRRCSSSIPSNIAEGRGRGTRKDFIQFLHIAQGSLFELETQLILIEKLYKLDINNLLKDIVEERKMLSGMLSKLKIESICRPESKKQ